MLTYYLPGPFNFTLRTENTGSTNLFMKLENMMTLETSSIQLNGYTFNNYENLLSFSLSIPSASTAGEYRAFISDASGSLANTIWHGTIQVFASQSVDKANYTNQNNQYISNVTSNRYTEYIIM
jgi:hypothetical protein